jgi:asparagine synthase (glutamine-hydrolysing)
VSYFNASEPNWDERPYFTAVEHKRAQVGCHIDVGEESFNLELEAEKFAAVPGLARNRSRIGQRFAARIGSQGNRVLLSGVGGDETLGGVPTPKPELADLLAGCQLVDLFQRLKSWALDRRKPWHYLLLETIGDFLPTWMAPLPPRPCPQAWLRHEFVERNRAAMYGYRSRLRLCPLPSFQHNLEILQYLTRQLGCIALPSCPTYEKRYPYLDRDLLAFIYAIPREQLVRPGQRRSLMRRSLAEIVPAQVLERRRKAFVIRAPMCAIATNWNQVTAVTTNMVSSELGIVDTGSFLSVLQQVRNGMDVPIVSVMRTLELELWLRHLMARKIVLAGRSEVLERTIPRSLKAGISFQLGFA